jgi:hypothetical protein
MGTRFGPKELIRFCVEQKLTPNKQGATNHQKYSLPPEACLSLKGKRTFVTVILNRKVYDPNTCSSYRRQLRELGISGEKIKNSL